MVTDFRYLNTRLLKLNVAFPLVRGNTQLGDVKVKYFQIDLRDAFHTLRLDEKSKHFAVLYRIMVQTLTYTNDLVWASGLQQLANFY